MQLLESHAVNLYDHVVSLQHACMCSKLAVAADRCVDGGADWANLIAFTASFANSHSHSDGIVCCGQWWANLIAFSVQPLLPTATAMASSAVDSGGLPISSETEFTFTIPTVNQVKSCVLRR